MINFQNILIFDFDEDDIPQESDAEVKLEPEKLLLKEWNFGKILMKSSKRKNGMNMIKNLDSKQIVNYTPNIIGANKSWK